MKLMPFYHITKLCLNLAILTTLGLLVRFGYGTFSRQVESQTEALKGAAIFIAGAVGWILLLKLSRSGVCRDIQPSLKITVLSVAAITLVLGLAGVQPIAGYMEGANIALGWATIILLINPLYVVATIAIVVWIIFTIRQ